MSPTWEVIHTLHPTTILAVTLLLLGPLAQAQPAPGPVNRQRSITLTGAPTQPVPEVRGARGSALMFLFDGLLQKELLQVDPSRLRIVDAGQRSLILEPLVDLADGERTEVRVAFAEGAPRQAILAIVPHPSEVDTWINVSRHVEDPEAVCQARIAERCGAQGPIAIRRSALLGNKGVSTGKLVRDPIPQDELEYVSGYAFREATWVLLEVQLENASDRAWSPRATVVRNEAGEVLGVRHVEVEREVLSPGETGLVWVEMAVPSSQAEVPRVLEMRGVDGRSVLLQPLQLPPPPKESAP